MPDLINIAGISSGVLQEQKSFARRRVSIIARDTRNSFRHTRLDDQGKLMFEVEGDGDFFGNLESGSVNGFPITDSTDLILSGRNWRRIGLSGMPNYPAVGQEYKFNFVKEHPPANIQFFNLGNGEVAFGTSGFFPENLKNFLIERLQGVVFAGVRLDYICFYLPGNQAFAFAGGNGAGFDRGALGSITVDKTPFTLAGEQSGAGLGSVYDPLAGGVFLA